MSRNKRIGRRVSGPMDFLNKRTAESGVIAAILSITTISLLSLSIPEYDPLRRAVYELAIADAVGTMPAATMRLIGYGAAGLLVVLLSLGLVWRSGMTPPGRAGAFFLTLSGLVWMLLGLLPGQFGKESIMVVNGLIGIFFALAGSIGLILLASSLRWPRPRRLLIAIAGLAVLGSSVASSPTLPLPGLVERACLLLYFAGIGVLGASRFIDHPRKP